MFINLERPATSLVNTLHRTPPHGSPRLGPSTFFGVPLHVHMALYSGRCGHFCFFRSDVYGVVHVTANFFGVAGLDYLGHLQCGLLCPLVSTQDARGHVVCVGLDQPRVEFDRTRLFSVGVQWRTARRLFARFAAGADCAVRMVYSMESLFIGGLIVFCFDF